METSFPKEVPPAAAVMPPVVSIPAVSPANFIAYSSLGPATRPGVATAIGITSIVLGAFGILSNLGAVIRAIMYGRTPGAIVLRTATTTLMYVQEVLTLTAAIALAVLGVLLLFNRRVARRGHLIYAWAKLGLIVLNFTATWLMYSEYLANAGGSGATEVNLIHATMGIWALISCVYPVVLLNVLRTERVKAYYESRP